MTPEKVLNAVYEQLRPLVMELAKYNLPPQESIKMNFGVGSVLFEFKDNRNEDNNRREYMFQA